MPFPLVGQPVGVHPLPARAWPGRAAGSDGPSYFMILSSSLPSGRRKSCLGASLEPQVNVGAALGALEGLWRASRPRGAQVKG
jgi:hypothetical protein